MHYPKRRNVDTGEDVAWCHGRIGPRLIPGLLPRAITALATWLTKVIDADLMGFHKSPVSTIMMATIIVKRVL